ncbi:MAG: hypothetical protein CL847_01780 [Crocinitomicaceae bacterium]|nr:hypothetical protein [Crocinitomicaceae bacterium]|tara:strand:+ start:8217 stop:8750 length:534 start_codon:yes stop_codon:yes gene_type:complete
MILAETKKKAHIVEYILFLWQIEDLVRAAQFDPKILEKWAENTASSEGSDSKREKEWIMSIAAEMRSQGKTESGHVASVSETMVELAHLHEMLVGPMEDKRYKEAFEVAQPIMKELSAKQPGPASHPVEQLLVVLYGFLILRLQKQSISAETESGFVAFRNWANVLAKGHIQIYYGG